MNRFDRQMVEVPLPSLEWLQPYLDDPRRAEAFDGSSGVSMSAPTDGRMLVVRIDEQRLYVVEGHQVPRIHSVSTAERGVGQNDGSLQTPLGWHRVAQRIGAGEPRGTIFRARASIGRVAEILSEPGVRSVDDNITTRILWLEGLEPGFNRGYSEQGTLVDSFRRYIYLHGTDEEGRIGSPASEGCVRLFNDDVIELFDATPLYTPVLILAHPGNPPAGHGGRGSDGIPVPVATGRFRARMVP